MEAKNLNDFLFLYDKFATAEAKSRRTIEAVIQAVKLFNRFLGGCPDIDRIEAEDLRKFIRHSQQRPKWVEHPAITSSPDKLSPHSVASYIRSIRSFWSWLKREGFIEANLFEGVKPPKTPKRTLAILNPEQIARILKCIPRDTECGRRDYAIIFTLYGTGLRISELLNLKIANIDFETGQIKVMGKGARERYVFMSARVFKVLLKYHRQWRHESTSDYLFVNNNGQRLTRFTITHRMEDYGKKAGISGVRCSPHTLRYSYAVGYLRNPGADTFSLQQLLGHATQEMTHHYAQFANGDIEARAKAFSPAEKLPIAV